MDGDEVKWKVFLVVHLVVESQISLSISPNRFLPFQLAGSSASGSVRDKPFPHSLS